MTSTMLEINGLTKRYGELIAVSDISLEVSDGELFTILGPSGSGKSSLLKCISGMEIPQEGSIQVNDEDVTRDPAFERPTAMVFQSLALFPHMSVHENISYGMKRQGVPESERKQRITEYLELVDLEGYGDRSIEELSGGERQRVALARALVVQPKVLLLDEALGSLDQQLRVKLQDKLYEIQKELDQTMVYVTHDQNVAFAISDRVAVMNDGEVEQVGTPEELYENPETPFIASFIGSSNSIAGVANTVDGEVVKATTENGEFSIRGRFVNGAVRDGEQVTIVVRYEDINIGTDHDSDNRFTGEIINKKYQGQNTSLLIHLSNDLTINVLTEDPLDYDIGDSVTVSWDEHDCLVFER